MTDEERRAIEYDCERLIKRYVNLNDAHDWRAVAALYTEDARMGRPSGGAPIEGRGAILDSFLARPPRAQRHAISNIVVDVDDASHATAFSVIMLYQGGPAAAGELPVMSANGPLVGWYRDRLVRTAEDWRFAERIGGLDFKP
ncbi:MAG: nuclear transport factor 2 family protein [Croceibacterium sp.]